MSYYYYVRTQQYLKTKIRSTYTNSRTNSTTTAARPLLQMEFYPQYLRSLTHNLNRYYLTLK